MPYPATPKTWVAGDTLTAAQLNAELRNALLGAFPLGPPDGAFTAYTPTLTQSATVTKTVTYGRYTRVGRLVIAQCELACTGAGTAANQVLAGLPVPAQGTTQKTIGQGYIFDASAAGLYKATVEISTAVSVAFRPTSTSANDFLGTAVFTAALASGDLVSFSVMYEAAT